MRKLLGALTLGLGLLAGTAQAETRLYYGLGIADGAIELDDEERSLSTANITLGVNLHEFIGLEVEVGASSDDLSSFLNESLAQYQAALLRLGFRWSRTNVYLLAGQARLDVDEMLGGVEPESVAAIGGGINLFGNETTSLNLHFLNLDSGRFTTATIGFQYHFGGFR